jgi:translation initiation factor IF-2
MPRICSICSLPDAGAIAVLLLEGRSARSVAMELGLPEDAMQRHARRHVAPVKLDAVRRRSTADPLDELVAALRDRALAGDIASAREYRLALSAQSDVRHAVAPQRPLEAELEWIELRTKMLVALEAFPQAKQAIADALEAAR